MLDDFHLYWVEFATIAAVHLLAVASPGPDFAVVMKHSISYGRRAAMYTSVGIGAGILVHVAYSLLGIGILIKTTPWLFNLLTYAAAAYLLYLGYGAIRSSAPKLVNDPLEKNENSLLTDRKAFLIGLVTNGINPKATLFFLSVFAVAVSAQTPNSIKMVYGGYLALATGLWFCFLSYFLSSQKVRTFLQSKGFWFNRLMGAVLILLALKLIIAP